MQQSVFNLVQLYMAITLRNGLHLGGGIGEFAREKSCSSRPFSKAVGLINEFNVATKRMELKLRSSPSTTWKLNCYSKFENRSDPSQYIVWWKRVHENYRDILSAGDLISVLKNAGNKLVVVEFYTPSCGDCRLLNPKMYQISKAHQEVIFLRVNVEAHKLLCDPLVVRLMPFFHLYSGAQGRICSFTCTTGTIYRMTGRLRKYGKGQSSPDPAKGLEGELSNFASDKEVRLEWPFEPSAYRGDLALHATKH